MAQFFQGLNRLLHQQLHHQSASCDGQVAADTAAAEQTDRVALLRCWLRAALDSHCRSAVADLTQQLGACSAFDTLALGACDPVCMHPGALTPHSSVTASEDICLHHAPLKLTEAAVSLCYRASSVGMAAGNCGGGRSGRR
jgi:hypothetical protein